MKKVYPINSGTVQEIEIVNYLQSQFKGVIFEQLGNNHAWHCGQLNCGIGFDVDNRDYVEVIDVSAEPQFHPEIKRSLDALFMEKNLSLK